MLEPASIPHRPQENNRGTSALHLQPAAKRYNYKRGDFPVAEKQADEVLALPHHQYLTNEQIEFVSKSINEFYQS